VQPRRVRDDDVLEALTPDRADDSLHVGILLGRAGRRADRLDVHGGDRGRDRSKRAISIMQKTARGFRLRKALRSCWAIQGSVGCSVTATCTIRLRSRQFSLVRTGSKLDHIGTRQGQEGSWWVRRTRPEERRGHANGSVN
jgi:hypothetical protein